MAAEPHSIHPHPNARLKILSLDPKEMLTVEAQFNPKELAQDKSVPWQKQKKKGPADLEYTGCEPWTMSLELLFDGFEGEVSVLEKIESLKQLTQHFGTKPSERRPPKVRVIWGTGREKLPSFDAVVESVSIKYTMFSADGQLLRATATVKFKEAADLAVGRQR
jgi:hypothetical protein